MSHVKYYGVVLAIPIGLIVLKVQNPRPRSIHYRVYDACST